MPRQISLPWVHFVDFDMYWLILHCLRQSSADNLTKQFGSRLGPPNIRPDLEPNCLTFSLILLLTEFFENII